MIDPDLAPRVERLLRGDCREKDLYRLFLGLRDRHGARGSVREIGDFAAHPAQRDKGLVTERAQDIFTSFESWLKISVMGQSFTLADIRKTAEANLRNATDVQLEANLGLKRAVVKSVIAQALNKLEKNKDATPREQRAVNYLGGAFIWNAAFTDIEMMDDLVHMLGEMGMLQKADHGPFCERGPFITLFVLTLLHRSKVLLESGIRAQLFAGFANTESRLEVKAMLTIPDLKKPVVAPACIFWTELRAADHCAAELLDTMKAWQGPLEIGDEGKLVALN